MTRIISPDEFNEVFLAVAKKRQGDLDECWSSSPAFTELFLDDEDGLLVAVARKLRLLYYRGGWGIDAILYERDDIVLGQWWPEQLTVIVEHENAWRGAHGEVNKLTTFNSPLKVLFTYPSPKRADSCLTKYASILRNADTFNDFTTQRKHLVTFGKKPTVTDQVSWDSYIYRIDKFVPLEKRR